MTRLTRTAKCMFSLDYEPRLLAHFYIRYFEGGVSSVFLWDLDDGGFAGVVLLKKSRLPYVLHGTPIYPHIDYLQLSMHPTRLHWALGIQSTCSRHLSGEGRLITN